MAHSIILIAQTVWTSLISVQISSSVWETGSSPTAIAERGGSDGSPTHCRSNERGRGSPLGNVRGRCFMTHSRPLSSNSARVSLPDNA